MCDKVGYGKGTKTGAWATFSVALVVSFGGFLLPFKMAVISNFGFLAAGSGGLYDGAMSMDIGQFYVDCLYGRCLQYTFLISNMLSV